MPQFGVYLTIVIYDHKFFIVHATGQQKARVPSLSIIIVLGPMLENIFDRDLRILVIS